MLDFEKVDGQIATSVGLLLILLYTFVGHRQNVQTQHRRHRERRLIRVSVVFLQNILLKFE